MGHNLETTILDYYGIPGSGKSTLSHNAAVELEKANKIVVEPSFALDHSYPKVLRKIIKFNILLSTLLFKRDLYKRIKLLVEINNYNPATGMYNQISNICSKLHFIFKYWKKVDYIVFDEGLAQASISLSINSSVHPLNNLNSIKSFIPNIPCITYKCVNCDESDALHRILARKSRDTRIEKQKDVRAQILLLKLYSKLVNQLKEGLD